MHQASGGRAMPPLVPKGFPLGVGDFANGSFSISVTEDGLCVSLQNHIFLPAKDTLSMQLENVNRL